MLIYDLSTVELCNMLEDNLYPDSEIEFGVGDTFASLVHRDTMTYAYVWTQPEGLVMITLPIYEKLLKSAAPSGSTPLAIVATPEGIYKFNLDVLKLEFETFSSDDHGDILVAELPIANGKHILEFYPDFDSQEEYLDSLMGDAEPSQWDESDTW